MKDQQTNDNRLEAWKPLPHRAPEGLLGGFWFRMRLFFDPEVRTVYRDLKVGLRGASGRVLEVGCGLQPYRHLLPMTAEYHALDWEKADDHFGYRAPGVLYYDGTRFPFGDGVFDLVFHTEVLEHVFELQPFLSECHRVLADNGQMLFTVPFAARNHYIPHDYWRLTPSSMARLLQDADFTGISVVPRGGDISVAMHKLNSLFFRILLRDMGTRGWRWIRLAFLALLFAAPVVLCTSIGNLSLWLKMGSPDDPLGYTVSCRKNARSQSPLQP